ncbi:MAG: SGNH/GDSL hydrolase family protein [Sandaracinaceae bacterium]
MKKAGLLVATSVVTLLLGECTMHVAGIGNPPFHDVHPVYGTAPIPGAEGVYQREGRAHVRMTEHGFRGVDRPRAKPEGTFRLAVLGDSYTEARQVELEQAFASRLEPMLAECPALAGRRVEVLNFGSTGWGTAQEYLALRHDALAWDPDAVLVAFLSGNDVSDDHPDLSFAPRPFYRLEDGALVLDESFRDSAWYREKSEGGLSRLLRRHSRIYQLFAHLGGRSAAREQRGELGIDDAIYAPPTTEAWTEAWDVTEALLRQMSRELQADGRGFYVVTLSNAIQVDPDPARRDAYRREIGLEGDLFYPDERIAAAGARDGYPVLSLAPRLRAHAERHHVYLHGFANTQMGTGHWNARGHRVAAEVMAPWLCARLAE